MTKTKEKPVYSRFEPCPTLTPDTKCIRVRSYNHGEGEPFTDLFHEHCPTHRISGDASTEMLKALVLRYEEAGAPHILRCYLDKRGEEPHAYNLQITVEYPEPGVLRKHCGTDMQAWVDSVINPKQFRQPHDDSD